MARAEKGMPARGSIPQQMPRIACYGIAFHILANYRDEIGSDDAFVARADYVNGKCRIEIGGTLCDGKAVEAAAGILPRLIRVPLIPFEAKCVSGEYKAHMGFAELSRKAVEEALSALRSVLVSIALTVNYEYFIVVGWNGGVATGYGRHDRIQLPHIQAVLFVHTHPISICYPSRNDLLSVADFLADGGLAALIASPHCISALRLIRPLIEDDYWALQEAASCVAKAKSAEHYMDCLGMLQKLESIVFELI
ncbi:hypothetical protein [Hyperthermus butylicus]|uniref:Uncharacterized protein n=1 Tax=Hyperthermus butylicus (strain DSM 5456 / JCM 9403 / PLM1-5) TaxID=415426 RepID=A2BM19_HYPBU|nr:hypothetical protein [Hyperthermus butylicus]ABM81030.1 hypothetical protein Hbut_1196 [Hyperthermus butylicus DSM 5456]